MFEYERKLYPKSPTPTLKIGELALLSASESHKQPTSEALGDIGRLALSTTVGERCPGDPVNIELARGGNYKVIRENLKKSGKANSKEPMSPERKRRRRRKRRRKSS